MRSNSSDSAPVFAALGDETRLRLVSRLCDDGPTSITNLTSGTADHSPGDHQTPARDAGRRVWCAAPRQGRESYWELDRRRLEEVRRNLALISKQWDNALNRLRKFVEE